MLSRGWLAVSKGFSVGGLVPPRPPKCAHSGAFHEGNGLVCRSIFLTPNAQNLHLQPGNPNPTKKDHRLQSGKQNPTKKIAVYSLETRIQPKKIAVYSLETRIQPKKIAVYSLENKIQPKKIAVYSLQNKIQQKKAWEVGSGKGSTNTTPQGAHPHELRKGRAASPRGPFAIRGAWGDWSPHTQKKIT